MKYKPNIDKVVRRYKAYWQSEDVDRPVVVINLETRLDPQDSYYHSDFDKTLAYHLKKFEERIDLEDDSIPQISTFSYFGHGFMPSLLGTPLLLESGSTWSKSILEDLESIDDLHLDWDCESYRLFKDFYAFFNDRNGGRFAGPQHAAKFTGEIFADLLHFR